MGRSDDRPVDGIRALRRGSPPGADHPDRFVGNDYIGALFGLSNPPSPASPVDLEPHRLSAQLHSPGSPPRVR